MMRAPDLNADNLSGDQCLIMVSPDPTSLRLVRPLVNDVKLYNVFLAAPSATSRGVLPDKFVMLGSAPAFRR